jgi:hypothetical protein
VEKRTISEKHPDLNLHWELTHCKKLLIMEFIVKKIGTPDEDGIQTVTVGKSTKIKLKTGQTSRRKLSYCVKLDVSKTRTIGGKEILDLTEFEIVKSEWIDSDGKKATTTWLLPIED